jgi:hypothetical protein
MNDSGFLEDGFKDLHEQRAKLRREAAQKRAEGFKQVKALDPMDGNKLKTIWVKKDAATIAFEETEAKKKELNKRHQEIERKKKVLELAKFEKEMNDSEAELKKVEKDLLKAGVKSIEEREAR